MSATTSGPTRRSPQAPLDTAEVPPPGKWHETFRRITQGNAIISVLAVLLALVVGGIMIAFTDEDVQAASRYFFARPGDTIAAVWDAVSGAYIALFQGSIYNFGAPTFARAIRPPSEEMMMAPSPPPLAIKPAARWTRCASSSR